MVSLLTLKKHKEDIVKPDVSAGTYLSQQDYIPYHCHYAADTLLTKNGELLKIIKISGNKLGLNYESGQSTQNTVRDTIRRAIAEHIKSDQFSFWIHTLKRRNPVHYESRYDEPFAQYVNEKWQEKSNWKHQYYNEIYITLLHDGQSAKLLDQQNLAHVMLPDRNRAFRNAYLKQAHAELESLSERIVESIRSHYNARPLHVTERATDDVPGMAGRPLFYSEMLEFLGIVCNLRAESYPLRDIAADIALSQHQLIFGYNALEVRTAKSDRRFAGILTLKHYHEIRPETVDRILQFPLEMIISQSFHFIPAALATRQYRGQRGVFEMSEDEYSLQATGLNAVWSNDRKSTTSYGKQQMMVMVLADELAQLDTDLVRAQQAFADIGIVAVREDIRLEEAYWSQLPGNFEFARRQDIIPASEAAGLTRLNLFPGGDSHGNHWGDAFALVPTVVNSPYFLNLHVQDNGHTAIMDYNSFHDASGLALLNFLLTASLKYHPRICVFDYGQSSRLFFDRLGGAYYLPPLGGERNGYRLNPFSLENTARNQAFLLAWCISLIEPHLKETPERREIIRQAIAALFDGPESKRHLSGFLEALAGADTELAEVLSQFHGRGRYAGLFDAHSESVDYAAALNAFDITDAMHAAHIALPVFSYLMHRLILSLDGRPAIIVLHQALRLLENSFFAPRMESLLEMLRQNNAIVISLVNNPPEAADTHTLRTLISSCATRIYVPDDVSFRYESGPHGLSDYDAHMLRRMDRQKGDFLLKQQQDAIGLRISFEHMDDIRAIFAGDIKNLIAAGGRFASLPDFY